MEQQRQHVGGEVKAITGKKSCTYFAQGRCVEGLECVFAHSIDPTEQILMLQPQPLSPALSVTPPLSLYKATECVIEISDSEDEEDEDVVWAGTTTPLNAFPIIDPPEERFEVCVQLSQGDHGPLHLRSHESKRRSMVPHFPPDSRKRPRVYQDVGVLEVRAITPLVCATGLAPWTPTSAAPVANAADVTPIAEVADVTPIAEATDVAPTAEAADVAPTAEAADVTPLAEAADVTPSARSRLDKLRLEMLRLEVRAITPLVCATGLTPWTPTSAAPVANAADVTPTAEAADVAPSARSRLDKLRLEVQAKRLAREREVATLGFRSGSVPTAAVDPAQLFRLGRSARGGSGSQGHTSHFSQGHVSTEPPWPRPASSGPPCPTGVQGRAVGIPTALQPGSTDRSEFPNRYFAGPAALPAVRTDPPMSSSTATSTASFTAPRHNQAVRFPKVKFGSSKDSRRRHGSVEGAVEGAVDLRLGAGAAPRADGAARSNLKRPAPASLSSSTDKSTDPAINADDPLDRSRRGKSYHKRLLCPSCGANRSLVCTSCRHCQLHCPCDACGCDSCLAFRIRLQRQSLLNDFDKYHRAETVRRNSIEQGKLLDEAKERYFRNAAQTSKRVDDDVARADRPHWRSSEPHACLMIPPGSTVQVAKKQYRRLCLLYHPDKSSKPDSKEAFLAITKAYRKIADSVWNAAAK